MSSTVLVLGARGRFGHAAATAFLDAGWRVRALARPGAAVMLDGAQAVEADARDRDALVAAAQGADVIVHALNLPYQDWARDALPLHDNVIAAARASGATILYPGNVYNYGRGLPAMLDETTPPENPVRKGAIRIMAEERLKQAAADGVRTIVLRAGDYFGGGAAGNWFDMVIAKNAARGRLAYPGPMDRDHAWAYLPDMARTCVMLADRRGALPAFAVFCFAGHTATGNELADTVAAALGRPVRVSGVPWPALRLMGLVRPFWREVVEMAYLWRRPHRLDGARLEGFLGAVPHTPFADAVRESLTALGAPVVAENRRPGRPGNDDFRFRHALS